MPFAFSKPRQFAGCAIMVVVISRVDRAPGYLASLTCSAVVDASASDVYSVLANPTRFPDVYGMIKVSTEWEDGRRKRLQGTHPTAPRSPPNVCSTVPRHQLPSSHELTVHDQSSHPLTAPCTRNP